MNVLVVHHRWGYGGGVVVFYYTVKALRDAGFNVIVATTDKPDLKSYEDVVGEPFPEGVKLYSLAPFTTRMFTIYKGFILTLAFRRFNYDVAVVTHGYAFKAKAPLIYYMHFPPVLTADPVWNPEYSKYSLKHPSVSGFRGLALSVPWWLYSRPYEFLVKKLYKPMLESATRILVNSSFTLKALKYTLSTFKVDATIMDKTRIVYPPLPRINEYVKARSPEKLYCAATIGRFSPEKRYELILETAKLTPGVEYYIAGGIYGRVSRSYYEKIKREAPPNVRVIANIPHNLKLELLSKCAAYIHTMVGEHFGIAPLEAIAAGATPIVPTFSGTWTDICLEGEYCHGYSKAEPRILAEKILTALEKPKEASLEHIEKFSPQKFAKEIVAEINSLAW
ncbi:MAG: glycosyltransferase family 4 protein [Thermoprotei archaeon]|nr:glycosyltransferase family 4 protein [Thermoprotei archaeon]